MATKLTTEQLAFHFCNVIKKELQEKKYTDNWALDFSIIKNELPNDFNPNIFLKLISDTFDINDIRIDNLDFKLRVIGRFRKKWTYSGEIPMTQEEFNRLKGFANGK